MQAFQIEKFQGHCDADAEKILQRIEFLGQVDVRHLEGAGRHQAAAAGAGHADLGQARVRRLAPHAGDQKIA